MSKQQNKKVYILGTDKIGWSIDKDRMYTIQAIEKIDGYEVTQCFFKADIVYAVWWNQLLSIKYRVMSLFFRKKTLACITNDLTHQIENLEKIIDRIDIFVYANSKQKEQLVAKGIKDTKLYFNPFYVDENIFKKLDLTKEELCAKFNIDFEKIKDKKLVGSFQRDSLGTDLSKAKWQKNPDMLIEIMNKLDNTYLLLLAGPRRHYIINRCKKLSIDYIYVGDLSYVDNNVDDLLINAIKIEDMPSLYNLIDLYIVSSSSEGGPKAIPESLLCGTHIISSDVGFARDLLTNDNIYSDSEDALKKISNLSMKSNINKYYTFSLFKQRVENILKGTI